MAEFSLHYLADYFDIPYPGDSMDLVAIPDFAFGAMENLGCVTFRETLLLADPEHATQGELQNVVDVIAHELAHMWFGDLVTMKWWNGIWLNEAFATFMELKVTDAFRPEWERWVSFGLARSTAFDTDALQTTRPIEYPVVSPADAEGMFDVLTYEKGAAVVRMLEQYLGEEEFRAGIRKYMANHQYGNTETTDLWDAIEEATGEPVRRIMDSWIFQGGHPIVSVDVARRTAGSCTSARSGSSTCATSSTTTRWAIPLQLRYALESGEVVSRHRAARRTTTLELDLPEPVRVGRRQRRRPRLLPRAHVGARCARRSWPRPRPCSPTSSATASSTTPGRRCSPAPPAADDFLALADGFTGETDVSVWRRLLAGLDQIDRLVEGDAREALQARVRALVGPALERLGWEERPDDADRDRELRGALIGALANLGADPDARAPGARSSSSATAPTPPASRPTWPPPSCGPPPPPPAPPRSTRSSSASRHGDTPQEELRFLYALAEVRDPEQMARVLELAMTPAVRTQNAPFLIGVLHRQPRQRRPGLEARARALGRDERAVPVQQHRAHAVGHPLGERPRPRRRHRGLHRRAPGAPGQADPPAAPRAHAGERGPPERARRTSGSSPDATLACQARSWAFC